MVDENTHEAAAIWTDAYPRRVTKRQVWAYSPQELLAEISKVEGAEPGYVSLYSFPNGHTKDNAIPRIDTLFLDFDIPDGAEESDDWEHELSKLLVRARRLAQIIIQEGNPEHWRVTLSGNKGIHLFHDFPEISKKQGTFGQFLNGVNKYANSLTSRFTELTGIGDLDSYIDASVTGDLGRLTRLPNTIHEKATEAHGETRYCVPATIEELAELRVGDYIRLTRSTRPVPDSCKRNPNQAAHDALVQYIRNAPVERSPTSRQPTVYDNTRIQDYKKYANEEIDVEDLDFVMQKRPCVKRFLRDEERFNHGGQSHVMEMKVITELLAEQVPIDTIVDAFDEASIDDSFSRQKTYSTIERYISGDFQNPSPVNCKKVWDELPFFKDRYCVGEDCEVYNREH